MKSKLASAKEDPVVITSLPSGRSLSRQGNGTAQYMPISETLIVPTGKRYDVFFDTTRKPGDRAFHHSNGRQAGVHTLSISILSLHPLGRHTLSDMLSDLDFADDICLLAHRHTDIQAIVTCYACRFPVTFS